MICQKCGLEAGPEAKFCVDCGSPLVLRCPACQNPYDLGSRFCSLCGRSLPEEIAPPPEEKQEQPETPELAPEPLQTETPAPSAERIQVETQSYPCPRCHQVNSPRSEYCYACGLPLEDSSISSSMPREPGGDSVRIPGGFWVRVLAYVVDTVMIAILFFVLSIFYGIYLAAAGNDLTDFGEQGFFLYAPFIVRAVYETVLIGSWSTTVGKRIFGLYVIRASDSNGGMEGIGTRPGTSISDEIRRAHLSVGLGRAFVRHLATYLSGLILGIGYLQVAFREDKLSLHDLISGTRVVRLSSRPVSR